MSLITCKAGQSFIFVGSLSIYLESWDRYVFLARNVMLCGVPWGKPFKTMHCLIRVTEYYGLIYLFTTFIDIFLNAKYEIKNPKEHPQRNWKWIYSVIIPNGAVFNFNFLRP